MADYKLQYLPKFFDDLERAANYIKYTLNKPSAANHLIDDVEKAILNRVEFCESFEPYESAKERKYKYHRIYVKNYIIYYVVIDDDPENKIMEVRRLLYKGRDRYRLI